jgi:type II secretory pathway predicted ATPase ExeA
MYEEFYGLKTKPFSKTPDPTFLYLSRAHEEALARLQYAVEEKEIVMLTGDVGCGKTTLTRALMDSLNEKYRIILILNPRLTPAQFLRVVAKRFEIDIQRNIKDSLLDAIHEKVYEDYEAGITPVIIIDEAQLIPRKETFEEIRLLTNFQLDDTNLLSLILVGQTDLRRRMGHKVYQPLRQRIGLFYHIGALSEEEIKGYIEHRLSVAGRQDALFTDGAIKSIYRYSGGVPRVINSLATAALLEGFGEGRKIIDESLVDAASRELCLHEYRQN